ncbi:hypothetical protein [Stenotrophomonas maltophilia]|uniref:hypothetical protein n=1 Tax=Stenotrophomonas maltophilia TaxID=40324 RepID=UPI0007EF602E|nr:hypothetical protein [Stenotrophomonas maltophilia]OBU49734.1 hypothetical protein A9K69_19490 [Stenotrophomonas maltophilia]
MPYATISLSVEPHHRVCILHAPDLHGLAHRVADRLGASLSALTVTMEDAALAAPALRDAHTCIVMLPAGCPDAAKINIQLEQLKIPTLFVERGVDTLRTGPWCHYGHTACPACIASIAPCFPAARAQDEGQPLTLDESDTADRIENTFTAILARRSPLVDGAVIHHDGTDRVEYVLKDPLCPVCSTWSRQPMEALYAHHG